MASQPANTLISVEYTVRAYRQDLRHEAILPLLGFPGMRGAVMSVPGHEDLVTETRDASDDIVTTSVDNNRVGLPIVRELRDVVTAAQAVVGIADLAMPKRIGRDIFLLKKVGSLTDDLHDELRSV
jgi:hypothetical protein